MPRTARGVEAGLIYHVLNRGNGRMTLFRKPEDFDAFLAVLAQGLKRYPVELLCYCLMGNHWHLVLRPSTDKGFARGRPFGDDKWTIATAARTNLGSTLRRPGRPKKGRNE